MDDPNRADDPQHIVRLSRMVTNVSWDIVETEAGRPGGLRMWAGCLHAQCVSRQAHSSPINRVYTSTASCNCSTAIHSPTVWAWSMLPGPSTSASIYC